MHSIDMPNPSPRSIFSVERNFGPHDAAIKELRARALQLMDKVARGAKRGAPAAHARFLDEARALQRAAAWLATLESPSMRRKMEAERTAMAA